MESIFYLLKSTLEAGKNAVLFVLITASGSTPRRAGSFMLLTQDGQRDGSVGGGAVEEHALAQAQRLLQIGEDFSDACGLAANGNVGMICGGAVRLLYLYFGAGDASRIKLVQSLCDMLNSHKSVRLAASVPEKGKSHVGLYEPAAGFLSADGSTLPDTSVSGQAILISGNPEWFLSPVLSEERAYIIGCGHVGKALCHLLAFLNFHVTACDERPELVCEQNLPDAEEHVFCESYQALPPQIQPGANDYVVVMTHSHSTDFAVLAQLLKAGTKYICCLGSKPKAAAAREYLLSHGYSEDQVDRIHCPAGIRFGGSTPPEVALSIAAQMVAVRNENPNFQK